MMNKDGDDKNGQELSKKSEAGAAVLVPQYLNGEIISYKPSIVVREALRLN